MKKLHVILALANDAASRFWAMVADTTKHMSNSTGAYTGFINTYQPNDDSVDEPKLRGSQRVVTTVNEKMNYFIDNTVAVDLTLCKERTNAMGLAKANLIVDGEDWGVLYSTELMALKNFVNDKVYGLFSVVPVRPDTDTYHEANLEEYRQRGIVMTPPVKQEIKTTEKQTVILNDPNYLAALQLGKQVQPATVTTQIDNVKKLGLQERFVYNGMSTSVERAAMLGRVTRLRDAINEALTKANDCEAVESPVTGKKVFSYLFSGKNA